MVSVGDSIARSSTPTEIGFTNSCIAYPRRSPTLYPYRLRHERTRRARLTARSHQIEPSHWRTTIHFFRLSSRITGRRLAPLSSFGSVAADTSLFCRRATCAKQPSCKELVVDGLNVSPWRGAVDRLRVGGER